MHPQLDLITPSPDLPDAVDTVVIGGGIIGVMTALTLAERGQRVALCEKGEVAAEQSCRNWGWVRRMGREASEYPLGIRSLSLWDDMNTRVGAETGFRRTGVVYTAETKAEAARLLTHHATATEFGVDARLLSPAEFAALMPDHKPLVRAALVTPDDGRAEPSMAVPAMARAAMVRGVHLLTHCAVRGLETEGGAVSAVITERGTIPCKSAVLAGGVWSRLFAGNLGIGLPVLKIKGSVMRTAPMEQGPNIAIGNGAFGMRRRLDGGFTIAPRDASEAQITPDSFRLMRHFLRAMVATRHEYRLQFGSVFWDELRAPRSWPWDAPSPMEQTRILNPVPSSKRLAKVRGALFRRFPGMDGIQEADRWAGMIDVTPDAVPIISRCALPGLILSTGYSGHGFGIGPAAGELTADLVMGQPPLIDPTPFCLDRFGTVRSPAGQRGLHATRT